MTKQMYTLGLSYGYHDSAACFWALMGRLHCSSRRTFYSKKNDFAFVTIHAGLKYLEISTDQIAKVGFYEQNVKKIARICLLNPDNCHELISKRLSSDPCFLNPEQEISNIFENIQYANCYPHHLSHAASSIFLDDSDHGLAIVIDGVGEFDSTSIWTYENGLINRVGGTQIPDSIGLLYAAITSFLDFRVNDGEYKVWACRLTRAKYAEKIWNLITIKDDIEYPFVIDQLHLDLTGNSCLLYRDSLKGYLV